jgi:hypothetical protein
MFRCNNCGELRDSDVVECLMDPYDRCELICDQCFYRVTDVYHPDAGFYVWVPQELREASGKYAKPGDTYWHTLVREPFVKKEDAEACLESGEGWDG